MVNQPIEVLFSDGTGGVERYPSCNSVFIEPRTVDVWSPPHINTKYPVLYMHDGQNLFDPVLSNTGIDWGMDEAVLQLMNQGLSRGAIVVGIWSGLDRWRDYMPQKPLAGEKAAQFRKLVYAPFGGQPQSDLYLRFLVQELKPFIDATYPTKPDRENTFIMGSSMGALVSLYALVEYPQVFGGAGCLSTHWPSGGMLLLEYFRETLPKPGRHKIYFDYGTQTLDADYEPYQQHMDGIMAAAGYRTGIDWITRKFPGADHSEAAWRQRVLVPLQFLLGYL